MKKIVLSIFALILFLGFWFTADYAAWCNTNERITWYNNWTAVWYNCKICNWDMYNFDQNRDGIDFYNRCCDWDSYNEVFWSDVLIENNRCCEDWSKVEEHNNIYWCYEICNWERYDASDAWFSMQCCDGKKQFITSDGPDQWYEICCSYGTAFTGGSCVSCEILDTIPSWWESNCNASTSNCDPAKIYTWANWTLLCCPGMMVPWDDWSPTCITNAEWTAWINMNSECLINWQCSYNIYQTLWIRKSDQNPSVTSFVQDIILAVTMFIGTVVSIVLVVSGILYVVAWIQWNSSTADTAKKGIVNSLIWLLLVVASYSIVRLIQFLATAWWG